MSDWQYIGLSIELSCILFVLCDIRRNTKRDDDNKK